MLKRSAREENPFELGDVPVPSNELPRGYRLRRVGPYEWVAEPGSRRWYVWGVVLLASAVSALGTALLVRQYYHRKATAAVVAVNGVPIRRDRLLADLEQRYGRAAVRRMVADELARQFAVARKCWPSEAEVEERFQKESREPGFTEELLKADMTETEYRERLRHRLAEVKLLVRGVTATEAEIRYFYERNIDPRNPSAVFRKPERVQVAVIGTRTREAASRARLELMRDVPWNQVISRYSVHPSRVHAGLLRPLVRGRNLFSSWPPVEARVFALREGDRSDPFAAGGFWWIVRCLRKWPAEVTPFEQARKEAEMGARIEKGVALNSEKLARERAEFVGKADIQVFDLTYEEVARPVVSAAGSNEGR